MAINFPDSPNNGDSFTSNNKTWVFDGTVWNITSGTNSVADDAITTAKIVDANVTAAKIASNAVTEGKINSGAVTQDKLASGLSAITVTTTANREAVIPSPFNGQFIFLTDTSQLQRWDGSQWIVAITTVPTGAPTGLALVSATSTTATISFSAGADGGSSITNYQYALSTDGGSTYGSYTALDPADATSPITITGLAAITTYHVKLKAVNALGTGSSESNALSFSTENLSVEYLVVAGGGGGGSHVGGGGGAGGLRTSVSGAVSGGNSATEAVASLSTGTYTVTVGGGGAGGGSNARGTNGVDSLFNAVTSLGGGGGGTWQGQGTITGIAGGSGGGAGGDDSAGSGAGGAGTTGQGFAGGSVGARAGQSNTSGAGGGGAGAAALNRTNSYDNIRRDGGVGLQNSISGTSFFYAGGGGSGTYNAVAGGFGGSGGGGGGGSTSSTGGTGGTGGTANGGNGGAGGGASGGTGGANTGGGGGAGAGGSAGVGGTGGSGVVIVRYLTADAANVTITGGTATTSGSYTVHTFTASGSLVVA